MEIQIRYHDVELPRLCAVEGGDWIDLRAAERVEMMGLIGMGNNPMVGATVAVAVAVEESSK